jgi:hypothetical protein
MGITTRRGFDAPVTASQARPVGLPDPMPHAAHSCLAGG